MSSGLVLENTARRDALIAIEKKYRKIWAEEHQFEIDAPSIEDEPITMAVSYTHLDVYKRQLLLFLKVIIELLIYVSMGLNLRFMYFLRNDMKVVSSLFIES